MEHSHAQGLGKGARALVLDRKFLSMNFFINFWRLKIVLKLILSRLPVNYRIWASIGLFRHGNMDRSGYAKRVVTRHLEKSRIQDLNGATVMEVGPGDSLASGVYLASQGASSVLLDSGDFADRRDHAYLNFIDQLPFESLRCADLFQAC